MSTAASQNQRGAAPLVALFRVSQPPGAWASLATDGFAGAYGSVARLASSVTMERCATRGVSVKSWYGTSPGRWIVDNGACGIGARGRQHTRIDLSHACGRLWGRSQSSEPTFRSSFQ